MNSEAVEVAAAASVAGAASKVTYSGSAAALGGWLVSSEAGVVLGLLIAAAGLAVQWYYRHREFRLKQAEHAARMTALGSGDS